MRESTSIRRMRGLAVALASVVAFSSTALGAGAFPALAQPVDETTVVETPSAPTEEVVTEAPPVETQAPEVVTTEAAPQPTPTSEAATTATTAASTSGSAPATSGSTSGAATSPTSSAALETSTSVTSGASTTMTGGSGTSATEPEQTSVGGTTAGGSTEPSTEGPTSAESTVEDSGSIEQAAGVTATPEPQRAEASPQDIAIAQDATPVEQDPPPAAPAEIDKLRNLILDPQENTDGASAAAPNASLAAAEQRVVQWQEDWVQYDEYYRPLIFNPYPEPLQLVYDVGGVPRLVLVPPFGRIVTEVRDIGSYNFTALRLNPFGIPIDYAVGNFFGGGYFPGPGLPPPAPPPPVRNLTDVPVQVKYTDATYRPIVVRRVVDVGPDPAQGGAHKVLLDGVTPAWGEWKQNEQGVPQFEVHQTQSFPGMEAPGAGPLPGNYDLQLVSDSTPTGLSGKDITLIVAAVVAAAVGIGAIVLTVFLGRRRRPLH